MLSALTSSGSLRPAKMLPFSLGFCLLGLFSLGDVSRGGGGGGGGGATLSLVGEIVSSNQSPKMGSLSSSKKIYVYESLRLELRDHERHVASHQKVKCTKLQTSS